MFDINLNELMALKSVLEFVSVKDLLTNAMHNFDETDTTKSRENADIIYKAIQTFLK